MGLVYLVWFWESRVNLVLKVQVIKARVKICFQVYILPSIVFLVGSNLFYHLLEEIWYQ